MPTIASCRASIRFASILSRTGIWSCFAFKRGEVQLIDKLTPALYERLASEAPGSAVDAGPTLESEFLWFNQAPQAPLADGEEGMVPIHRVPARDFKSDPARRSVPRGLSRPCESGVRSGLAGQQAVVQRGDDARDIRSGGGLEAAGIGRISNARPDPCGTVMETPWSFP